MQKPNFENLLKVLNRKPTEQPVLFEFFFSNIEIAEHLSGIKQDSIWHMMRDPAANIAAMTNAGYDYITMNGSDLWFPNENVQTGASRNMNEGAVIYDRESFDSYAWPEPYKCSQKLLVEAGKLLPKGMKVITMGPCGVLENVIRLVGFDNLCLMLFDDRELVRKLFDEVGSRFIEYYETCLKYDFVGAIISNDDWGFNSGTMLSPDDMREFVFPWHKRIVETAHKAGRPAILHSCGNLEAVYDEIIDDMKFDAKHSNEDKILPVEEAYKRYGDRIAILGGIDVDFLIRADDKDIITRCEKMIALTQKKGGYALGSGNSIAEYVPLNKYLTMINVIRKIRNEL